MWCTFDVREGSVHVVYMWCTCGGHLEGREGEGS